ncbi:PIN domain-like protein [Ephemerocybe angulata]|uniref:PIN domain-like protein n=1 Tax=Ephemerocybe angulata TaxID=980116 RepID=A0A8H6MFN0_9AGAR|nr:PIN domain-like protein [Tulosesus angulatus]
MGVQGLIPFLRKVCPNVFQKLPNRFKDITGKHVVIDGTLITQRFHFSPSTHPHRHVLGWYRVAEEMRQSGVMATCVFDGKSRHSAKLKEVMRRRSAQKLTATRGRIEGGRLQRLDALKDLFAALSSLPPAALQRTLEALKALSSKHDGDQTVQDTLRTLSSQASDDAVSELISGVVLTNTTLGPLDTIGPTKEDALRVQAALVHLYQEFLQSLSQLATITQEDAKPPILPPADAVDQHINTLMTKAQAHLAVQEKRLWDGLSTVSPKDSERLTELTAVAGNLVSQSYDMSSSFNRRTNLPTSTTYEESREILRAMGIQCILSEGDVEAEGLASAMVLTGKADFVASEDTDVLVYGAPLIRNLAGSYSHSPLEIVTGKDIQETLNLDRPGYVDFALLLGTDFSQRLSNVGPVRALKLIKSYGDIEHILENEPKYSPKISRAEYLDEINTARTIFSSCPPVLDPATLSPLSHSDAAVARTLSRYNLDRALMESSSWDPEEAFAGNYFQDAPNAT